MVEEYKEHDIKCPYCGYEDENSWESPFEKDGDSEVIECGKCDKEFLCVYNLESSYTTTGICKNNKHDWSDWVEHGRIDNTKFKFRQCKICEKHESKEVQV